MKFASRFFLFLFTDGAGASLPVLLSARRDFYEILRKILKLIKKELYRIMKKKNNNNLKNGKMNQKLNL